MPKTRRGRARGAPRVRAETLYALVFVFLMAGLAAAVFAWYETVNSAVTAVCSPNQSVSCAAVDHSGDTHSFGVPDWAVGIAGYVVMVGVAALAYRTFDRRYLMGLGLLSAIGVLISLVFVYQEAFVIHALCPVCTTAHLCNVGVLVCSAWLLRLSRPDADESDGPGSPSGPPSTPD